MIYRPNACTDLLSQELTPGRDPAVRPGSVLMSDGAFPLMSGAHVAQIIATFARSRRIYTVRSVDDSPERIAANEVDLPRFTQSKTGFVFFLFATKHYFNHFMRAHQLDA